MHSYETVTEALAELKKRGYTTDFNLAFDMIKCNETGLCLMPSQFDIVEHHRFEGFTNPADEEVVYVIESKDGTTKGSLVSAYGAYSGDASDEMITKLGMKE